MALFLGSPRWAGARRELLDFMVQGKINRGRHTDHLAGCHFIRTNQCPPPNMPIFLEAGCCPANSVKALKAKSYDTEYIVYSKKLMVCEHAQTITVFNNATNTYNRQEYTNIKNTIHVHNNITILSNKITTSNKIQLQLLSTKAVVGINQWQI